MIARRERPHPGALLRITDRDGCRITVFATNTPAAGPSVLTSLTSCGQVASWNRSTDVERL